MTAGPVPPRPAVFLDRDDTLIECAGLPPAPPPAVPGDLTDPARVRLLAGVGAALERLARAGFALVVITNQGVVARGGATPRRVEAVNDALRATVLEEAGIALEGVYYCPFHPRGRVAGLDREHPWRKPGAGMIRAAEAELGLDRARSWLVGDAPRDVEAGVAAGLAPERCLRVGPEADLPDLAAAAEVILASSGAPGAGDERCTLTMAGAPGGDLDGPGVRSMVLALARGIAERAGVRVLALGVRHNALHVTLAGDRLAGLGLLSELRRSSGAWHQSRTGRALWMGE